MQSLILKEKNTKRKMEKCVEYINIGTHQPLTSNLFEIGGGQYGKTSWEVLLFSPSSWSNDRTR
ncbi:hypothetical protein GCM10028868_18340 [Virgibacillus kimchii]